MIKTVVWGLGAMGAGMAKLVAGKPGYKLVGAIDLRQEMTGVELSEINDIGEPGAGIKISRDGEKVLAETKPDITLLATNSFVDAIFPDLQLVLTHGSNCITLAEEMAYPWHSHPEQAALLNDLAVKNEATLLGTGVNPGFVLDTLILLLSGVCSQVDRIHAARINDLSEFGPTVMRTQGVGTTLREFQEGITKGDIVGHVGFRQSIDMMSDALGWALDEIIEERLPIVSDIRRETAYAIVEPGDVAGCNHVAKGMLHGKEVIRLEHPQQVRADLAKVQTGDHIKIFGKPDINLTISPEIPGGLATMNLAVNMMSSAMSGKHGLRTMLDFPLPHFNRMT